MSSGELDSSMSSENKATHTCLVWEDVTVVTNNFIRNGAAGKLLNGITGYAITSRIMAIMGPSGSGKSTLLDALAGRLSPNTMMVGNVLKIGKQRSRANKSVSYVTQEDILLGTLTVRETLTYSAHLRLPSEMTNAEIDEVVENTLLKMGLNDCVDNKVGNWHIRGISGGEKRRLSISLELLTQPNMMFLDEPTTGLDSASAFFVVAALKRIALDGKIVVCAVHQPNSYIFDLFDDLFLLSNGETIYFGEAKLAERFFSDAGFPCPARRNPADHFLRCINSDFDKIGAILLQRRRDSVTPDQSLNPKNMSTEDIRATLVEKYKSSGYAISTRTRIREIKLIEVEDSGVDEYRKKNNNSWWKQLFALTKRSLVNMSRDWAYYWIRIPFCISISLGAGILYFDIGLSHSAFIDRSKCYSYLFGFLLCLSIGGIPSFMEELKVSNHERLNGHYGEGVFVLSNFLSSLPFIVFLSISSGSIVFYMVKFQMGFDRYVYLCIVFFFCYDIMECIVMIVTVFVPNFLMGLGASAGVIVVLLIASGLYRPLPEIPKFFWHYPMSYISFTSWAVQGQYKNDMIGLEFEPMRPGEPKIEGKIILQTVFGIQLQRSKWWDVAILAFFFFLHKLLFFTLLKYKARVSSLLHRLHRSRRSFELVAKRPSFRMDHFTSSRRHQPLHSLSSQEGLSSPLT